MHEVDTAAINAQTKPELGYDHRDVDYKALAKWFTGFFALTVFFIGLTIGIHALLTGTPVGQPVRTVPDLRLPEAPNPLLQSGFTAKYDMFQIRRQEAARLSSQGWVDETQGVVHIPIDRAMELMAERAARTSAGPAAGAGEGNPPAAAGEAMP
ncbi:MAG: hypothetical protein SNJ76_13305 [Fimbriimonadaceae bacterium]